MARKALTSTAQLSLMWAPAPPPPTPPAAPAPIPITPPPAPAPAPKAAPSARPPAWVDPLPDYVAWLRTRRLSKKTVHGYTLLLRALEAWAGRPLVALTAADLQTTAGYTHSLVTAATKARLRAVL